MRKEHSALREGRLIDLHYDDQAYVFARQDQHETLIIAFNRDGSEKTATLPVGVLGVRDGAELSPLIGRGAGGRVAKGQATLGIPAKTVTAYTVR
jgi:hypothetical protein